MERWKGKVAVVTGASSGIGFAIAKQLVEDGLHVVGLVLSIPPLDQQRLIEPNKKGKLILHKTNISNQIEVVDAFKWIQQNYGPVHILVNSAGVGTNTSLINGDIESWKQCFDTNVLGLCIATRTAINQMKANHINGHIVHINCILGHYVPAIPGLGIYPASKHAVTALTDTLYYELNANQLKIKITSVSPGMVESKMTTFNQDVDEETRQLLAESPILKAQDVADAVQYALSTPQHVLIKELIIRPMWEMY